MDQLIQEASESVNEAVLAECAVNVAAMAGNESSRLIMMAFDEMNVIN